MKQVATLLIVFIALVGAYFAVREYAEPGEFTPPEELAFDGWTEDAFTELAIQSTDALITLVKQQDDTWLVNDFDADETRLSVFLNKLEEMETTSRVSTNAENHERFQVGDTAIQFTATFVDGRQEELLIGKSAGGNSVYVRIPGNDDVYVIDKAIRPLFRTDLLEWRVRQISTVGMQDVESVNFTNRSENYTLGKSSEDYTLQRAGRAKIALDAELSGPWLNRFLEMQATDFAAQEELDAVADRTALATVTTTKAFVVEGQPDKEVYKVYSSVKDDFYLIVREEDQTGYHVSKTTFDDLFPRYSVLLDELS